MGMVNKLSGAALGFVGAAIATASAPVTIGAMIAGAAVNELVNDDDKSTARREGHKEGFKDGVNHANQKMCDNLIKYHANKS